MLITRNVIVRPSGLALVEIQTHKALSNESRIEIIRLLYMNSLTVNEISKKVKIQPITVRHHLRILEEADLIKHEDFKKGTVGRPIVKYQIAREAPQISFPRRQYLTLSNLFITTSSFLLGEKRAGELFKKVGFEMGVSTVKKLEAKYDIKEWSLEKFTDVFVNKYLKEIGSEPQIVDVKKGKIVYKLHNCIFYELAVDKPDIVCDLLHDNFSKGISEGLGGKVKFERPKCLARGDGFCEHTCKWSK